MSLSDHSPRVAGTPLWLAFGLAVSASAFLLAYRGLSVTVYAAIGLLAIGVIAITWTMADGTRNATAVDPEQERANAILRSAIDSAVIAIDPHDGLITFFDEGAEQLLGHTAESVIGCSLTQTLHVPRELSDHMTATGTADALESLTQRARAGEVETLPWTYRRRDGSTVPVAVTMSPEYDGNGDLLGFIGIARDVSDQRRFEEYVTDSLERERAMFAQLRASNDLRTEFVSSVSHELRNPLSNVLGYTEVLLAGDLGQLDVKQSEALRLVDRNSQRLLRLVDDLLALSEMSEPASDAAPVEVDLRSVVHGARLAVGLDAERSGVEIVTQRTDDATVLGHADQLQRVFVNLFGNAIKFSSGGGVVEFALVAGETATVTVSDNGPGMTEEELARVFERFSRSTRASGEPTMQGPGLGLPIARGIVEQHGGRIDVHSTLGAGTRVTVALPIAVSGPARSATNHFAHAGA